MTLKEFNQAVEDNITEYYKYHDTKSFFNIDALLRVCRDSNLTENEVPRIVELQNIVVLG